MTMLFAAPAQAVVSCAYDALNEEVVIAMSLASDAVTLALDPSDGDTIRVTGTGGPANSTCPGADVARVSNTRKIVVDANAAGATAQNVTIDLRNGLFAPGVGADVGVAEIEWELNFGTNSTTSSDKLFIVGTAGQDFIRVGTSGVNLNNDADIDITFSNDPVDPYSVDEIDVSGGGGDDTLTAEGEPAVSDTATKTVVFRGGDGNDVLTAGAAGGDVVSYSDAPTGVVVNLEVTGTQNTGFGTDQLQNFERVVGSAFGDKLRAFPGPTSNRLSGGAGNDVLVYTPGGSSDDYRGEDGVDWVDLSEAGGPALVSICANSTDDVCSTSTVESSLIDGGNHSIRGSVENITGTLFNDKITGTTATNHFSGLSGNDELKGAPASSGDAADVLDGGTGDDILTGQGGNDRLIPGPGTDTVVGGSGTDAVDYSSANGGVTVTLFDPPLADPTADPPFENVGADQGFDSNDVEDIIGSEFDDILTGNDGDGNVLTGLGGDDIINGLGDEDVIFPGAGDDVADGGPGLLDEIDYGDAMSGVTVNLASGTATSPTDGDDTIISINNANGSPFDDVLVGNSSVNVLNGDDGDDVINGRTNNDVLNGEGGSDWASYENASAGVTVDVAAGATGADGNDVYASAFENAIGSQFGDLILGNSSANSLKGLGGVDNIDGMGATDTVNGGPGSDTLAGGDGSDWLSYTDAPSAVTVSLGTTQTSGGDGPDTIATFENITGSGFNDLLTGNSSINRIDGGSGNDFINGGTNADFEDGGPGNDVFFQENASNGGDTISGGSGTGDTVDYRQRNALVSYSFDGQANDGEAGEGDNLLSDVETVLTPTPAVVTLSPSSDTNQINTSHTVTATVKDSNGNPAPNGTAVNFTVTGTDGESPTTKTATTTGGNAQFSFASSRMGYTTISADSAGGSDTAEKLWTCPEVGIPYFGFDIARDVVLLPNDQCSGYMLDGYGGIHPFGGATATATGAPYFAGSDIARGIDLKADGSGGYLVDGFGGIHPFGLSGSAPPAASGVPYFGFDIARDIDITTGNQGYILDGYGGMHPFNGAPNTSGAPYFAGFDIAREIELKDSNDGGYLLDGYGGLHPFSAGGSAPPAASGLPYFGFDIARDLVLTDNDSGYILDGYGGMHPFGGNRAIRGAPYFAGFDIASAFVLYLRGGHLLDGFGGLHEIYG